MTLLPPRAVTRALAPPAAPAILVAGCSLFDGGREAFRGPYAFRGRGAAGEQHARAAERAGGGASRRAPRPVGERLGHRDGRARQRHRFIYQEYIAPVLLGEFGSKFEDSKDVQWMDEMLAHLGATST